MTQDVVMKKIYIICSLSIVIWVIASCGSLPLNGVVAEPTTTPPLLLPSFENNQIIVVSITPTPLAPEPQTLGKIVFLSDRDGNDDIYRMNSDGSGLARLTDTSTRKATPVWSPDHSRIAFVAEERGTPHIYMIQPDGTALQRITHELQAAHSPTWSPDGERLAFVIPGRAHDTIAWIMIETGDVTELTSAFGSVTHLAWSPDGRDLAFSSPDGTIDGKRDIFLMPIDGIAPTINLTNAPGDDDAPAWSTAGRGQDVRIAFQSDRDGQTEVYVMQRNGTAQTRLTRHRAFDGQPTWSSDGRWIAFVSDRGGSEAIYMMRDNGSDQTLIAPSVSRDWHPHWQPPPPVPAIRELVFSMTPHRVNRNLVLMNENGTGLTYVTRDATADDISPAWSPDGTRIAFAGHRGSTYDIWVLPVDGSSDPQNLTESDEREMHPVWSPDGTRIAFEARHGNTWDVFVMRADGSDEPQNLTNSPSRDGNPTWSPDGRRLAFASDRGGNFDIYVMDVDGREPPRNITRSPTKDVFPDWSPTADEIVYRSVIDGRSQLFVVRADGTELRPLLLSQSNDDQPSWSPDGRSVAFVSDRSDISGRSMNPTGMTQIFVFHTETREVVAVSPPVERAQYPAWRPIPTDIGGGQ